MSNHHVLFEVSELKDTEGNANGVHVRRTEAPDRGEVTFLAPVDSSPEYLLSRGRVALMQHSTINSRKAS